MTDALKEAKARQRRRMFAAREREGPSVHFPPVPGETARGYNQPATTFCRLPWPTRLSRKGHDCHDCGQRYQEAPDLYEQAIDAHQAAEIAANDPHATGEQPMKKRLPSRQCMATYTHPSLRRVSTTVWCQKREGHEGDHRGTRRQWNQQGESVPITEPPR